MLAADDIFGPRRRAPATGSSEGSGVNSGGSVEKNSSLICFRAAVFWGRRGGATVPIRLQSSQHSGWSQSSLGPYKKVSLFYLEEHIFNNVGPQLQVQVVRFGSQCIGVWQPSSVRVNLPARSSSFTWYFNAKIYDHYCSPGNCEINLQDETS